MKNEAKFQTKMNRWLKYNFNHNAVFESKVSLTDSLPFSAVKDHQIESLLSIKKNGLIFKPSDETRDRKPCDCIKMINVEAYVVVYYKSRGNKEFYIIDIDDFVNEKRLSKTKSLSIARARSIADSIGILQS